MSNAMRESLASLTCVLSPERQSCAPRSGKSLGLASTVSQPSPQFYEWINDGGTRDAGPSYVDGIIVEELPARHCC